MTSLPSIPMNATQKLADIIRGGKFTVVGSGGSTEQPIDAGGWATYRPAVGTRALIKGTLTLLALGSNTFLSVTVFDNTAGRLIEIARVDANQPSVEFEIEIQREFTCSVTGDNAANDGSCDVLSYVRELPI